MLGKTLSHPLGEGCWAVFLPPGVVGGGVLGNAFVPGAKQGGGGKDEGINRVTKGAPLTVAAGVALKT